MGGFLADIFLSVHEDIRLEERDILRVAPRGLLDFPRRHDSFGANLQFVVETGHMPQVWWLRSNDQYIDWSSDDAFTRAITEVRENTVERIKHDPALQGLLDRDSWSREDRVAWERSVSAIVNDEHLNIPGLSQYRNVAEMVDDPENPEEKIQKYLDVERRATRLNDLAVDIENSTQTIEHDCETMSIFEGVILQQVDNALLPDEASEGDLKKASNYFYTVGRINSYGEGMGRDSPHAWVVSSATANIIEGTNTRGHSYITGVDPELTFEAYVRGATFYGEHNSIYTNYKNSAFDIMTMRIERGDIDYTQIYESIPLRSDITQKTYDDAPPEAQALIELKTRIVELVKESVDQNGIQMQPATVGMYRSRFDKALDDLVADAGIYKVLGYNPLRRDTLTALSVGEDEKFEIAAEWVKEMNPGWERGRIDAYVQERIAYKIPELDSGEYEDYAAFREATIQSKMENEFPGIDFDEAEEFFYSEEGIEAYVRYMNMLGAGSMQDMIDDPQAQMAGAFDTVLAYMDKLPAPDTIEAHAKEVDNLRVLQAEYNQFKQQQAQASELGTPMSDIAGIKM